MFKTFNVVLFYLHAHAITTPDAKTAISSIPFAQPHYDAPSKFVVCECPIIPRQRTTFEFRRLMFETLSVVFWICMRMRSQRDCAVHCSILQTLFSFHRHSRNSIRHTNLCVPCAQWSGGIIQLLHPHTARWKSSVSAFFICMRMRQHMYVMYH